MVKKTFSAAGYLHIPVHGSRPGAGFYVEVWAGGVCRGEFFINLRISEEIPSFYVALYAARYGAEEITLICRDEGAPADLFDGIREGRSIPEEPALYPDLYREPCRQQIHFSPARGWLNDPNGLFYRDGVFHMYFQHNPLGNQHMGVNVSWGHAVTEDCVHFREYPDAIMPRNSLVSVASGSAVTDRYDLAGFGKDAVIAAYTDLESPCYRGRPARDRRAGQCVMVSTDGGMTFRDVAEGANPVIPVVPYNLAWRDPKLFFLDEKTLCMAVYETWEGKNCVSFYRSGDARRWEFCSRNTDLYECPDLFPLKADDGTCRWVLYGGNGRYRVGEFRDFTFYPDGDEGWLDYGGACYAGQTFSGYPDETRRIHAAWLTDPELSLWAGEEACERTKDVGFSQSMSILCTLSLHKTARGYRVFRKPAEALYGLRRERRSILLQGALKPAVPGEITFTMDRSLSVTAGGIGGFSYDADTRTLSSSSGREYTLCATGAPRVRLFADRRSLECFIGDEISLSYSGDLPAGGIAVSCGEPLPADMWTLDSIWNVNQKG